MADVVGLTIKPVIKTTGKLATTQDLIQVALSRKDGNKAFVELGEVTDEVAQKIKAAKNYSDKDIEKTIKKWEELSQSMRSGILTRLDNGWYVEKKKTGVASRYEFTNGEQYLANSKKNDSN